MKYLLILGLFLTSLLFGISFFLPQLQEGKLHEDNTLKSEGWSSSVSVVSPSPTSTVGPPKSNDISTQQAKLPKSSTQTPIPSSSIFPQTEQNSILGATTAPSQTVIPTPTPTAQTLFLNLIAPTGDITVILPVYTIVGKTVPNAEVFINDSALRANALGVFTYAFQLEMGENLISVSVNDVNGVYNEKEIIITYNKP